MSYCVPKNKANDTNLLESSTENEADTASNVPMTTDNEKPVSLELHPGLPAQGPAQVSVPHSTEYTMYVVDTCLCMLP